MTLWLVDAATGRQVAVDKASAEEIRDYTFSYDGGWIAYSKSSPNYQSALWLYNVSTGQKHQITDAAFSDSNPVFSRDGRFLFFLSNRDFNLAFSSFEFDYLYNNATRVYAIPLKDDGSSLSPNKIDIEPYGDATLENEGADAKGSNVSKESTSKSKGEKITIDLDGIQNRIEVLPMSNCNYNILGAVEE